MRWFSALLLILFTLPLLAQDLVIPGATTIEVERQIVVKEKLPFVKSLPFAIEAPQGGALYAWTLPATVTGTDRGSSLTVTSAPKGVSTITVRWVMLVVDFEAKKAELVQKSATIVFVVGEVVPPKPPDPQPSPSPIPVDGFRVLIVYEAMDALSASQRLVLTAKDVRDYLNSKCVMGPDNKTREWRIWDKDVDTSAESELWRNAMKRERKGTPWLIISNHPTGGYEGALPDTVEKMMELLRKHGGN